MFLHMLQIKQCKLETKPSSIMTGGTKYVDIAIELNWKADT